MEPSGLTPAFLSGVLGAEVLAVEQSRVGTGQVGMNVRCRLTYAGSRADHLPESVVAKLPSDDASSRAVGLALRNYEREVGFYRELAPTVDVRTPRCFFADRDNATGDFVLVLEDLAPAVQGDQIAGCGIEQAALALTELAALHAPRWGDGTLAAIEWLQRREPGDLERLQGLYDGCLGPFVDRYGARLTDEQVELARRFSSRIGAFLALGVPPFTVTHGDYRLDNLLFGTVDGGYPVAVVDWQTPGLGVAFADLSYFCGAGLLTDDRRAHERDLVAHYGAELRRRGVDVGPDTCWEGYRRFAFSGVIMSVVASMIVGQTERGDDMFVAMGSRHLQHALDLDSLAALG